MADYFIGDIQGCFNGLQNALAEIGYCSGKDTLWLTGDLVARGENSLATIEFIIKNDSHIRTVLGNHDLHLLSVAKRVKSANPKDKLQDLLSSPNIVNICDWLRQQPLLLELPDNTGFMSHAGLPPNWSIDDAKTFAKKIHKQLVHKNYVRFLQGMYSNKPDFWQRDLSVSEQLVYAVNGLTRMRYCTKEGKLDLSYKEAPNTLSPDSKLVPWFEFQADRFNDTKWVFGHWASLMGKSVNPNIIPLDTGYVWGNYLTVLNWQTKQTIKIMAESRP